MRKKQVAANCYQSRPINISTINISLVQFSTTRYNIKTVTNVDITQIKITVSGCSRTHSTALTLCCYASTEDFTVAGDKFVLQKTTRVRNTLSLAAEDAGTHRTRRATVYSFDRTDLLSSRN